LHDACLLAFGTEHPEKPANKRLMSKDDWLRLAIWKQILERAWGRAPVEVKFDVIQKRESTLTREQLSKMSDDELATLWRERVARRPQIEYQPG
jgi:hypothetical protein